MVIWKYSLKIADLQVVQMPATAMLLSVGNQRGQLCLWALVDPEDDKAGREIEIIGTGNPIPDAQRTFIGSVIIEPFVWHVCERRRASF